MHKNKNVINNIAKKPQPIKSYGLGVYTNDPELLFLLYQRRDTYEYIEFIRGMWSSEYRLTEFFASFSIEERERIRNYIFSELWDDMFIIKSYKIYKDGFAKAKAKYDSIRHIIPKLLDATEHVNLIQSAPWGFPKGKKNGHIEDSIVCALREFEEETKMSTTNMIIHKDIEFTESFKGSNNKDYTSNYYLAYIHTPIKPIYVKTSSSIRKKTISEEANDVGWFTYEEAKKMLDPMKMKILDEIMATLPKIK